MLTLWLRVVTTFVTIKAKLTFARFVSRARERGVRITRPVSHSIPERSVFLTDVFCILPEGAAPGFTSMQTLWLKVQTHCTRT